MTNIINKSDIGMSQKKIARMGRVPVLEKSSQESKKMPCLEKGI